MPLLDKMKQQASQVGKRAQEAGKAGQAKLDEIQAKRRVDALYRDLGAAVYADRSNDPNLDTTKEADRLIREISELIAQQSSATD